jgi:hypothetical protein
LKIWRFEDLLPSVLTDGQKYRTSPPRGFSPNLSGWAKALGEGDRFSYPSAKADGNKFSNSTLRRGGIFVSVVQMSHSLKKILWSEE